MMQYFLHSENGVPDHQGALSKTFLHRTMSWLTLVARSNESVKFIYMGRKRRASGHSQWWRARKACGPFLGPSPQFSILLFNFFLLFAHLKWKRLWLTIYIHHLFAAQKTQWRAEARGFSLVEWKWCEQVLKEQTDCLGVHASWPARGVCVCVYVEYKDSWLGVLLFVNTDLTEVFSLSLL